MKFSHTAPCDSVIISVSPLWIAPQRPLAFFLPANCDLTLQPGWRQAARKCQHQIPVPDHELQPPESGLGLYLLSSQVILLLYQYQEPETEY
jgi:hypothetical protein